MSQDPTRPGESVAAVTKHDSTDVGRVGNEWPRALWVGGEGDVNLVTPDGASAVFVAVPAGTLIEVRFKRVNASSTTASSMVAIY